jgi:hypothetical protein
LEDCPLLLFDHQLQQLGEFYSVSTFLLWSDLQAENVLEDQLQLNNFSVTNSMGENVRHSSNPLSPSLIAQHLNELPQQQVLESESGTSQGEPAISHLKPAPQRS